MASGWERLVGPILTDRDAVEVLAGLSGVWYAFAGIQFIALAALALMGEPGEGVSEIVLHALAGYFLPRTRSRILAVALLLNAILSAGFTVAAWIGLTEGGRNVIVVVFLLLFGFRGTQATMVYHSKVGSVPLWKNAAIVGAILFGAGLITAEATLVVQAFFGWKMSSDAVGAAIYVAWLAVHLMTRRRFPLVVRPMAQIGGTASN